MLRRLGWWLLDPNHPGPTVIGFLVALGVLQLLPHKPAGLPFVIGFLGGAMTITYTQVLARRLARGRRMAEPEPAREPPPIALQFSVFPGRSNDHYSVELRFDPALMSSQSAVRALRNAAADLEDIGRLRASDLN